MVYSSPYLKNSSRRPGKCHSWMRMMCMQLTSTLNYYQLDGSLCKFSSRRLIQLDSKWCFILHSSALLVSFEKLSTFASKSILLLVLLARNSCSSSEGQGFRDPVEGFYRSLIQEFQWILIGLWVKNAFVGKLAVAVAPFFCFSSFRLEGKHFV